MYCRSRRACWQGGLSDSSQSISGMVTATDFAPKRCDMIWRLMMLCTAVSQAFLLLWPLLWRMSFVPARIMTQAYLELAIDGMGKSKVHCHSYLP